MSLIRKLKLSKEKDLPTKVLAQCPAGTLSAALDYSLGLGMDWGCSGTS